MFDYTSKKILTIQNLYKTVQKEINQVKTMDNPKNDCWIVKPQHNHSIIYETNCIRCLSGVGKEGKKKLVEAGITQVFLLAAIGSNKMEVKQLIREIAEATKLTVSVIKPSMLMLWKINTETSHRR